MKNHYRSGDKKALMLFLALITLFLLSFTSSALIFINSKKLVFADNIEDIESLTAKIESQEERIIDLEEQVERYKNLYEAAKRDASFIPPKITPTKEPSNNNKSTPDATKKPNDTPKENSEQQTEIPKATPKNDTEKPDNSDKPESTLAPTPTKSPETTVNPTTEPDSNAD